MVDRDGPSTNHQRSWWLFLWRRNKIHEEIKDSQKRVSFQFLSWWLVLGTNIYKMPLEQPITYTTDCYPEVITTKSPLKNYTKWRSMIKNLECLIVKCSSTSQNNLERNSMEPLFQVYFWFVMKIIQ